MRIYAEKGLSLQALWNSFDKDEIFPDIKTLYRYHNNLIKQIDNILKIIVSDMTTLDSTSQVPDLLPGEQTIQNKLKLLFSMIDRLIDILHEKNLTGIILHEERNCFLHAYLYQKAGLIFLDSS